MTDTPAAVLLAALIWKLTDFVKHCTNRDRSAIVTQLSAWLIGFGVVVLFAHSSLSAHLVIDGISVAKAPWADQLLLGLVVGSFGSAGYDIKRAIDGSDSAATPPLIPAPGVTSPAAGIGPATPGQPAPDPAVIGSDATPADAPPPPGLSRAEQDPPESMGLAEPPPFLGTPAGRAAVRTKGSRR